MIEEFKKFANILRHDNISLVRDVYAADVHFIDPLHEVRGLTSLERYFERLYRGVADISFDFHSEVQNGTQGFLSWTMNMRHKTFRPNETLSLPGVSFLKYDGNKITYHRDYFDAGAMLYERVPVLGTVIRSIKKKV